MRSAKAEGLDITCETAPHYLVLSRDDIEDHGRFKMNPPIKGKEDQAALLEALRDGTIDMIATDHAPHSAEEKAKRIFWERLRYRRDGNSISECSILTW